MKLTEVLSTTLPFTWKTEGRNYGMAEFEVNGKYYAVDFTKYKATDNIPERWDIEFALIPPPDDKVNLGRTDITGTGDQFAVMSTVSAIIKDWFYGNTPECITMTAETNSRKKLYTRLLKNAYPHGDIQLRGHLLIATNLN